MVLIHELQNSSNFLVRYYVYKISAPSKSFNYIRKPFWNAAIFLQYIYNISYYNCYIDNIEPELILFAPVGGDIWRYKSQVVKYFEKY